MSLPARELGRISASQAFQLDQLEEFENPPMDLSLHRPLGPAADSQAEGDIIGDCHVPKEGIVLEDESDLAGAHAFLRHVFAVN